MKTEISKEKMGSVLVSTACETTSSAYGECFLIVNGQLEIISKGKSNKMVRNTYELDEESLPGYTAVTG
jgi:hypothetical protein